MKKYFKSTALKYTAATLKQILKELERKWLRRILLMITYARPGTSVFYKQTFMD